MYHQALVRKIETEMQAARRARAVGNEGRARVCARRAAGHAIRAYRGSLGLTDGDHSAYFLLHWIASLPDVAERLRAGARRLATRVTPQHDLPHPQDPLADAGMLIDGLLDLARAQPNSSGPDWHEEPGADA